VGSSLTEQDNRNLASQSIQVGSITNTRSYAYDGVNRLLMAVEGGTAASTGSCPGGVTWCEQYGYDRFGNRFVAGHSGVGEAMATPNTNTTFTNNHISTASYDDAGNESGALGVPGSIVYDQESRQATVKLNAPFLGLAESYSYAYDSEGRRVSRSLTPLALTSTYVYDAGGSLAAEYRNGSLQKEFIYGAGRLLEVQDTVQGTSYLSTDHPGSTRLVTNASGNAISRHDYLPFGKEMPVNLGSRNTIAGYANPQAGSQPADERVLQRFTGQEDDPETGLQYFHARYYSGAQGRFMSPDPAGILAADPTNPQSWNQYAYVLNNPLIFSDPTGKECVWDDGSFDSADDPVTGSEGGCKGQCGTWVDPTGFRLLGAPGSWGLGDWSADPNDRVAAFAALFGAGMPYDLTPSIDKGKGCIATSSLSIVQRAVLTGPSDLASTSGGVRGLGAGGAGAFQTSAGTGGGGSAQVLWMADYTGQKGLYWAVSGGPTVGRSGFGMLAGLQYLTSTARTSVTIQDVVNSFLSVGFAGAAGLGAGVDINVQTGVATGTIGVGGGGWGGAGAISVGSGFIPVCQ
jgi:RHS repeat-associated protein